MNGTYDIKNGVRAKVAFLGLFVAALVLARLMVAIRTAVVLSEPIRLSHAGFSVAMPNGNGWRSSRRWEYKQSAFVLSGTFALSNSRPTASARCTCVFPAELVDLRDRFEQKRREIGGEIAGEGQIETDVATVEWVHIQEAAPRFHTIFGSAELPYNRRIDIEVLESTGDVDFAKCVFQAVAASISATESPMLEAGRKIIAEMKSKGLASFLDNQNRQSLFLIADPARGIIGFEKNVLVDTGSTGNFNMEAGGLEYIQGRFIQERLTSYQSDDRFDRFIWKTETVLPETVIVERSGVGIVLEDSGTLTVSRLGESPGQSSYMTSGTVMPEILLEQFLSHMLASGAKEAVVDIIGSGGQVVPTYITVITPEGGAADRDFSHLVKLSGPDGQRSHQFVYLDEWKQIVKRDLRGAERRIFESATPEDAARLFPKRKEFILQSEKLKKYLDERI